MNKSKQIVKAILADLTDRSGIGDEWNNIDMDIQKEIRAEWERLVKEILET